MTKTADIIRFDTKNKDFLEAWPEADPDILETEAPSERGYFYHEIKEQGLQVGIWDATPFTQKPSPYPVDEYMLFMEGDLTMVMPDGEEVQINSGDAFIIPKGLNCQWRQSGYVHKVFMILDGPVPEADNPSLHRITVPDLSASGNGVDLIATRTDFMNAAGTMRVDVETFGAMSQPSTKVEEHLLVSVLDGQLTLNDGDADHTFGKGDTAYIHQGGTVGWATSAGTRVIVARYAAP